MKKILNLVFVLALLLVHVVPVNALSGTNSDSGSITINNTLEGKTYSVYEILTLESYDTERNAYTYKVEKSGVWDDFINSTDIKGVYVEVDENNIVTWIKDADPKEFSLKALEYAKEFDIKATSFKEADGNSVVFENLNLGYYLVDSSLGALCGLTTTKPTAVINEKNGEVTIKKEVLENTTGKYGEENTDYIGKTIYFKTTIDVENGAENYVLHDVMSSGLTLNQDSIKVYLNGEEVLAKTTVLEEEITNYTITFKRVNDVVSGFVVTFENTYTANLDSDDEIVVEYTALLNKDAVVGDNGNTNETWLEYGDNHETTKDTTVTYTYKFDLVKTNSANEVLTGAKFKLYDSKTDGNEIKVVWDEEKSAYRLAYDNETGVEIEVGNATIIGLDIDTFYLEETKAPEGYNKLTSRVEVIISEEKELEATIEEGTWISGGVHVVNLTGAELPETGGMGTMLFITVGSLMVLGFGVLLVVRLRISKMED